MNIKDYETYPAIIEGNDHDGYTVEIRGLDHAHTQGDTLDEAKSMAYELIVDCAGFDAGKRPLAKGSALRAGEVPISVPADVALKFMLRDAMLDARMTVAALAKKLGEPYTTVRNTLDFRRATKLDTMSRYFAAVGTPLNISY